MTTPVAPAPSKPAESTPTTTPAAPSQQATPTSPVAPAPAAPAQPASPFAQLSAADKDRLLSVYAGTIRDQNQRLEKLETDSAEAKKVAAQPTPTENAAKNKQFYERPYEATQELVRTEIQAAVAPIIDLVRSSTRQTDYDRIKTELKADPRFRDALTNTEGYVDQLIQQQVARGQPVTREVVVTAISGVHGAASLGLLDLGVAPKPSEVAPTTNTQPASPTLTTPPHLRPSAPPAPGGGDNGQPKLRDLNEQEERLRRENHMTKEEFLAGMEMAANDVVKMDKWPAKEQPRQPGGLR